jgi:hypothetical protein
VQEYLVWQVFEQKLDWFHLQGGSYMLQQPDGNGVVRSLVFPGLWLAVPALLAENMAPVLAVLQEGLNLPEYFKFVQELSARL